MKCLNTGGGIAEQHYEVGRFHDVYIAYPQDGNGYGIEMLNGPNQSSDFSGIAVTAASGMCGYLQGQGSMSLGDCDGVTAGWEIDGTSDLSITGGDNEYSGPGFILDTGAHVDLSGVLFMFVGPPYLPTVSNIIQNNSSTLNIGCSVARQSFDYSSTLVTHAAFATTTSTCVQGMLTNSANQGDPGVSEQTDNNGVVGVISPFVVRDSGHPFSTDVNHSPMLSYLNPSTPSGTTQCPLTTLVAGVATTVDLCDFVHKTYYTASNIPLATNAVKGIMHGDTTSLNCVDGVCSAVAGSTITPAWMKNLGTGAYGSVEFSSTGSCSTSPTHCVINCTLSAPCSIAGSAYNEMQATSVTVDSGAYIYADMCGGGTPFGNSWHVSGTMTLNGTILANAAKTSCTGLVGFGGGPGGGSGGGTLIGATGKNSTLSLGNPVPGNGLGIFSLSGGAPGALGGNPGTNAAAWDTARLTAWLNTGSGGTDGLIFSGGSGVQGGSTGGAAGKAGGGIAIYANTIDGTGGVINVSGGYGTPAAANATGSGSGGGGGFVLLYSFNAFTANPTIYFTPGPGALCQVPQVLATGGSCTTPPTATLGVTAGAFDGTLAVVAAGAGCGTGTGITWNFLGGGGTPGTAAVVPTWSSGTLATGTVTPGTSSGYTAATYTTCGAGGNGGAGHAALCTNATGCTIQ